MSNKKIRIKLKGFYVLSKEDLKIMPERYKRRKDGLYSTRVTLGEGSQKIIKTVYGRTQKELKEKISILKKDGIKKLNGFKELSDEWKNEKQKTVRYATFKSYISAVEKLSSLFDKFIEEISTDDVQKIINNLHEKAYSKSILLRVRLVYGMIVDFAISKNIKATNYIKQIKIPDNAVRRIRTALNDKEIETVNNSINKPFGLYAYLMLYTGLRRGEMLALQWKDIDKKRKMISITKSIEYIRNRPYIKEPKSKSGIRKVPILNNLMPYLQNSPEDKNFYVFGGENILSETMIRRRWYKYIKATGLNITQHQLRHSYATILYRAGIDPKTAQNLLGHADVQTTLNIYTHLEKEISQNTFDKINNFVSI